MLRKAAVKGFFYPESAQDITSFIEAHRAEPQGPARCVFAPHAGYVYSGATAVKTISSVDIPPIVVLLGPNHTGFGDDLALSPDDAWDTPLGPVPVDKDLNDALTATGLFDADIVAHAREHSLEVMVPILKGLRDDVSIVPVTMMPRRYEDCLTVAKALGGVLAGRDDVMILVSTDMNHYENAEVTEKKDQAAIDAILDLDAKTLYETVRDDEISMCGIYPAVVGIETVKILGASSARLVEHTHSGHVSGDFKEVVGYAGIVVQ